MIGIRVGLDKRRQLKNGNYNIVYWVSYRRALTSLTTGFNCKEGEWNVEKEVINSYKAEGRVISQGIQEKKVLLLQRALEYERKYPDGGSLKSVKEFLVRKSVITDTVKQFWIREINRLQESRLYGNARNYSSALGGIQGVINLDIPFTYIDFTWLTTVETLLRKRGVSTNGIAVYFRHLRSIINRAIDNELIDGLRYPFKRYKIKTEVTTPRPITLCEVQKIVQFKAESINEQKAKDFALLIFMLRGVNFADLATLTLDNYRDGRIIYNRKKTGKQYSVLVTNDIKDILLKYQSSTSKLLLPIISEDELKDEMRLIPTLMQRRKTFNKWLKKIGVILGIKEPLTTYVFRYTHANICKQLGYSKDLISESLGHGYGLAVSSNYLESYDIGLIDEMNTTVIKEVLRS